MSILRQLTTELTRLIGYSSPTPTTKLFSGPDGIQLEIDFRAVDSMSCSVAEIRLAVPSLVGAAFDKLKAWGAEFCRRVTYLLENMGPLELDPDAGQVLIRSTPPDKSATGVQFYEVVLQSHANGNFTLRRYRTDKGSPGRQAVDIVATHEVLKKLVNDLVDSIPGP
jgi:hypothetical protein